MFIRLQLAQGGRTLMDTVEVIIVNSLIVVLFTVLIILVIMADRK